MAKMTPRRIVACGSLASVLLFSTAAHAAYLDYIVGLGIEHNDNINFNADDPISDNILIPSLAFTLSEQGSTVQAQVAGRIEYRDYLRGTYGGEFRNAIEGTVNWVLLPERLSLVIQDNLAVDRVSVTDPNTPSNLQQTNVFAIGPNLLFRIGPTLHGQAELRYLNSYAEITDGFNSQRYGAALRLGKDLSATSRLSANAQVWRTDFKDADAIDYDRYDLFARYMHRLSQVDLQGDAGWSWLNFDQNAGNRSNPLLRGNATWRATAQTSLGATVARQYSDSSSEIIDAATTIGGIPPSIVVGDTPVGGFVFRDTSAALNYAYQGVRFGATVSPFYRQWHYLTDGEIQTGLDQSSRGVVLGASWLLRPLLMLDASVRHEKVNYRTSDRRDKDAEIRIGLRQQWTRHWSWHGDVRHWRRSSSVEDAGFTQNLIFFGITYAR